MSLAIAVWVLTAVVSTFSATGVSGDAGSGDIFLPGGETCTIVPADESSCCQSTLEPPISISVSLETYPDDLPVAEINPLHIAVASNAEGNVTYTCTINNGNVIWQLGSCGSEEEGRLYYQMVDRDQFLPNGVITQQSNATLSTLMLLEEGRQYLSDRLQSNVIYVQCLAVVDKLNVYSGERHTVELYDTPPPAPTRLSLTPTSSDTTVLLQWSRPDCLSDAVPLSYTVTVTDTNTTNTVFQCTTDDTCLEVEVLSNQTCERLSFSVVASTGQSSSNAATVEDTVPLSLDVSTVSNLLSAVVALDLANESDIRVTISLMFTEASTPDLCSGSASYPATRYSATVEGLEGTANTSSSANQPLRLELASADFEPEILFNSVYSVTLLACNEFSCRELPPLQIYTTQVQSASVVFFGTVVYLSCSYAENADTSECKFTFYLPNGEESFTLPRSNDSACFQARNTREAYERIEVRGCSEEDLPLTPSVRDGLMNESLCRDRGGDGTGDDDVLSSTAESSESALALTCTLAPDSEAVGCLFVLASPSPGSMQAFSVVIATGSTTGQLCVQSDYRQYTYRVYALLEGGAVAPPPPPPPAQSVVTVADLSATCDPDPSPEEEIATTSVTYSDAVVLFSCSLRPGSSALGCLFTLYSQSEKSLGTFPVTDTASCNRRKYNSDSDEVQVYAILSDGSLGPGTVVAPVRSPTEDESGCPAEEEGGGESRAEGLSSGAAAGVSVVVTVVVVVLVGGVVIAAVALWLVRRRPTKPDTGEDIVFQQKQEEEEESHDNENEGVEEGADL